MQGDTVTVPARRFDRGGDSPCQEMLAVEEPLEIRLNGDLVGVTMRTPGHDAELAAGFLYSESLIGAVDSVGVDRNVADVSSPGAVVDAGARRNFVVTSACGVCGRSSVDRLAESCTRLAVSPWRVPSSVITALPGVLRARQIVFERTGALHAAALFNLDGELLLLREDVGRHNALDKVIGASLTAGRLPLSDTILLVSGRASFELVQKAVKAGIPILASVGAPSSLAVQTALRFQLTLAGFVRGERFNVYAAPERLTP